MRASPITQTCASLNISAAAVLCLLVERFSSNSLPWALVQTSSKLYLVLDFINGGHLFFQLYRQGIFTEVGSLPCLMWWWNKPSSLDVDNCLLTNV